MYIREIGASYATLFSMPILFNSLEKVRSNPVFWVLPKGKVKNTEHLQPFSEIVKIIVKVYEQSIFWCTVLLAFKYILLLPSPAARVHIYRATFSSQLFYLVTVIKIYSNLEELSGAWEQTTAAWQNTVFMIKICTIAV